MRCKTYKKNIFLFSGEEKKNPAYGDDSDDYYNQDSDDSSLSSDGDSILIGVEEGEDFRNYQDHQDVIIEYKAV